MHLQAVFDRVVAAGRLKPSRIAPIRTAVRQYAIMLGFSSPAQCPLEAYNLPTGRRQQLIEERANPTLSLHAVRNLKNNMAFFLRQAVELQLIPPPAGTLKSWRGARAVHTLPTRHESKQPPPYFLRTLPPKLAQELHEYTEWSTALYAKGRPARLKKRAVTMKAHHITIMALAGFLVTYKGLPAESLSLVDMVDPDHVRDYVQWCVNGQGRITSTILMRLGHLQVLAKHWLKRPDFVEGLATLKQTLPPPEAVREKATRWLSLREIDACGQSWYPLNARRLKDMAHPHPRTHRYYAYWVQRALVLRLLVRIPFRQRNLREMRLGRNLYQDQGVWVIEFRGEELKVAHRRGRLNQVKFVFPAELVGLLEEWLTRWRPLLTRDPEDHVFVTSEGKPFASPEEFSKLIQRGTYKFTGIAVNPHTIRDIWATEYIKATKDIVGAAYMLGNTVEVVLKHYAHLLDAEAEVRARAWLTEHLALSEAPGRPDPLPPRETPQAAALASPERPHTSRRRR